jgi:membrane fusion protein, heavy metal efflux system
MKNKLIISLAALMIVMIIILKYSLTDAHEGHDEGPVSATGAPLGELFLITKESQFLLGIRTEIASVRTLNYTINTTGRIIPSAMGIADIYSPLPGRITGSNLPIIGTRVSAGSNLLRVEQTLNIQDKMSIAAERIKAEEEYKQASADYERLSQLEGVVAGKDLIEAEIKLNAAEKTLAYYSSLLRGRTAASFINITSPISGVIVESDVTAGEQIDSEKKLFTIVNINNLWAESDIYETDINKISNVSLSNIMVEGYPNEVFRGRIINIGNVIDESSRTIKVIFEVTNRNQILKVGMFANINIITNNSSEAVTVPKESVVDIGGKNVVFIHSHALSFKGVEVLIGRDDGKFIEILKGLEGGERVVTTGNYQLRSYIQ